MILLSVSLTCNFWFAFLLLYDQIVDTRFVRFLISMVELWKSLDAGKAEAGTGNKRASAEPVDVIGKSHSKMASTRTMTAIPTQEAATPEKAIELSEDDITFAEEKAETKSTSDVSDVQVPDEKLNDVFSSIPPSEVKYVEGDNEMEEGKSASGSSFDEIAYAVDTVRKQNLTVKEKHNVGKVMAELENTELFDKIISAVSDETLSDRIYDAIALYVDGKGSSKSNADMKVAIPDDIKDFDPRQFFND